MAILTILQENFSYQSLALATVGLFVLYTVVLRYIEHRKITRLGHYSFILPTYLPWSLDFLFRSVRSTFRGSNLEFMRDEMWGASKSWTVETRPLGVRFIFTADPANVKALLATQFEDFGKGEAQHQELRPFLGDSIFATDGKQWHDSRQLIRPSFTKDRVSDLYCFEAHVQTLFRAMANGGPLTHEGQVVDMEKGNGRIVDMRDLFFRLTLDITTEFLMGEDVKSLMKPREPFMEAFDDVQRWQSIIARASAGRHAIHKPRYWQGIKVMDAFVDKYVQRALRLSPEELKSNTKSSKGYTFLHEVACYTRDPKVIRDQVVAILLAGRDTTAGTLSWVIYEISRRPDIVAKLRAEILEIVGRNHEPSYEHLKNMPYLKSILNETLRLYPSVPFNVRYSLRDTTIPRGGGPRGDQPVGVLKGTPVVYSTLVMQRRSDLYPAPLPTSFPDPAIFEPERWNDWFPKPHDYIPFNAGPRICIGQQFALTEMSYVLCRMFQKFDRVTSHMDQIDGGNPSLQSDITLSPGQGVYVSFWEAKD